MHSRLRGGVIRTTARRDAWHELWDLDGFHPDTGGWPGYLDLLLRWARENESRAVRFPPDDRARQAAEVTPGNEFPPGMWSNGRP